MSCLICERIEMIKSSTNPHFVCELETGYVVIGDHQHFRGYTLFLCKQHVTELHFMPKDMRVRHLEEMALVSEAVYNAFGAEKMNCELLGNGDAHVHWHLFPRKTGDAPKRGPVWKVPEEEMYSDAKRPSPGELAEMVSKLRCEMDRLIRANQ